MYQQLTNCVTLLAGSILICSVGLAADGQTHATVADDEAAVRKVFKELVDYFRSEGATTHERLAQILADDFIRLDGSGTVAIGRDDGLEVLAKGRIRTEGVFLDFREEAEIRNLRVSGDIAFVFSRITIAGKSKRTGKNVALPGWSSVVLERREGQWKIVNAVFVFSSSVKLPQSASAPPRRFSLKWGKTDRVFGPFDFQDKATVKIGNTEFTLIEE